MDESVPFWWMLEGNSGYLEPMQRTKKPARDDSESLAALRREANRVTAGKRRRRPNRSSSEPQLLLQSGHGGHGGGRGGGRGSRGSRGSRGDRGDRGGSREGGLNVVGMPQNIYLTTPELRDPRNTKKPPPVPTEDVDRQAERKAKKEQAEKEATRRERLERCQRRQNTIVLYRSRLASEMQVEKQRLGRPTSSGEPVPRPGPVSPTSSVSRDQQASREGPASPSMSRSASRSGAGSGSFFSADDAPENVFESLSSAAAGTEVSASWGLLLGSEEEANPASRGQPVVQKFRVVEMEGVLDNRQAGSCSGGGGGGGGGGGQGGGGASEAATQVPLDPYQTQGHFRGSTKTFPPLFRSYHGPAGIDFENSDVDWDDDRRRGSRDSRGSRDPSVVSTVGGGADNQATAEEDSLVDGLFNTLPEIGTTPVEPQPSLSAEMSLLSRVSAGRSCEDAKGLTEDARLGMMIMREPAELR